MPTHHNPVKEERHIFISFLFFFILFYFYQRRNRNKAAAEWSQKQPLIFGIACKLWEQVNSVWLVNFKCTKTWKSGKSPNSNFINFDKFT